MNPTQTRVTALVTVAKGGVTYDEVRGDFFIAGVRVRGALRRTYTTLRANALIDFTTRKGDELSLTAKGEEYLASLAAGVRASPNPPAWLAEHVRWLEQRAGQSIDNPSQ